MVVARISCFHFRSWRHGCWRLLSQLPLFSGHTIIPQFLKRHCAYVCVRACMCKYIKVWFLLAHIHTSVYTRTRIHTCIYVHIRIFLLMATCRKTIAYFAQTNWLFCSFHFSSLSLCSFFLIFFLFFAFVVFYYLYAPIVLAFLTYTLQCYVMMTICSHCARHCCCHYYCCCCILFGRISHRDFPFQPPTFYTVLRWLFLASRWCAHSRRWWNERKVGVWDAAVSVVDGSVTVIQEMFKHMLNYHIWWCLLAKRAFNAFNSLSGCHCTHTQTLALAYVYMSIAKYKCALLYL